ncbi:hypothetical protein ACJ72_03631 [Emergomyces africanus]|uniref:Uncharacterized protein n=1 Tax=Emergomyces africanus TaxID=1955775 RepID=A0A1B7NZ10_9EURO|nr:hypothetical protein ACJ72_03631 [Emergomyces africanus]
MAIKAELREESRESRKYWRAEFLNQNYVSDESQFGMEAYLENYQLLSKNPPLLSLPRSSPRKLAALLRPPNMRFADLSLPDKPLIIPGRQFALVGRAAPTNCITQMCCPPFAGPG